MNDRSLTEVGLAVVYSGVCVVMLLTERVERSRALRFWSVTFFLLRS
jgi:hypothetical protein